MSFLFQKISAQLDIYKKEVENILKYHYAAYTLRAELERSPCQMICNAGIIQNWIFFAQQFIYFFL